MFNAARIITAITFGAATDGYGPALSSIARRHKRTQLHSVISMVSHPNMIP